MLTIGIAQTKIFRDPVAGAMHATIFWGFMVLTAGTVEILIQGVFRDFSFALFLAASRSTQLYRSFAGRVRGARHRARSAFAFYRRLVLHPKRLEGDKLEHTDALIILSMIGGLMVTLLLANACQYLARPARDRAGEDRVARRRRRHRVVDPHPADARARCSGGCTRC